MKKMLFIYNPHSGKAQLKTKLSDILELYTKGGFDVLVHPTQCKGDAAKVVEKYGKKFDLVVCSGGDGTINEVVDGLMLLDKRPMVGYIPTGTVNDFASSHRLSKTIMTAAQTVLDGMPFACDVGSFNEENFTYIAAFGLFTDVAYQTPQQIKNILGRMAYLMEGAKRLGNIQSFSMTVVADGEETSGEFIFGMVTNSTSIGGFKGLSGKQVQLDDGLFEVVLVRKPENPVEMHYIVQSLMTASPHPDFFYTKRAAEISFTSDAPVDWTLDGEYGGTEKQVLVRNHHQAIRILEDIPKKSE